MEISETSGKRFDLALELLQEGKSISFSGVSFQLAAPNKVLLRVESSWQPERISKQNALEDLQSADKAMDYLCGKSPKFSGLVEGRDVETVLVVDYGMGGIEICTQSAAGIQWQKGYPVSASI